MDSPKPTVEKAEQWNLNERRKKQATVKSTWHWLTMSIMDVEACPSVHPLRRDYVHFRMNQFLRNKF